jgi:hypothetical protein
MLWAAGLRFPCPRPVRVDSAPSPSFCPTLSRRLACVNAFGGATEAGDSSPAFTGGNLLAHSNVAPAVLSNCNDRPERSPFAPRASLLERPVQLFLSPSFSRRAHSLSSPFALVRILRFRRRRRQKFHAKQWMDKTCSKDANTGAGEEQS